MLLGDRYRLISTPVSNGSFGAVYAADDEKMPRRVAVKILHAQHATNVTVRERFRRELAAVCRVQHENVVSVFDVGEDDRLGLYYVMELVQGTPLRDRISDTPPPWPFIFRVASQLASALVAIHGADIVHRDLKPQNIMLVERPGFDELVKVLDFGIASIRENNEDALDAVLTGARNVLGTPPYMAPEQTYMRADRLRLGLDVDARSDIYALGVVLYELVTGRRPFTGDAHTVVLAHRNVQPMPLDRIAGLQAPRGFLKLVMQCLEKKPEDRPQTARAFLDALLPIEHERFTVVLADAPLRQTVEDDAPTEMFAVDADPLAAWETGQSRRRAVWAVLATALGAGAVAIALSVGGGEEGASGAGGAASAARMTSPVPVDGPAAPTAAAGPVAGEADAAPANVNTEAVAVADTVDRGAPETPAPVVVAPSPASVVITSVPAEVEVEIDGAPVGTTPLTHEVPVGDTARTLKVRLSRAGHEPREIEVAVGPEQAGRVVLLNETLTRVRRGAPAPATGTGTSPTARPPADPFEDL
jgi:tRNA A-37 threonylcarbamoyl transferase component Bud32